MTVLRIEIEQAALDAYLYGGHLFAILPNGGLHALSMKALFSNLLLAYPKHEVVLRLATIRGDWLANDQARRVYGSGAMRRTLFKMWRAAASSTLFVKTKANQWRHLSDVDLPIQDLRFHALRAYVGSRTGVSELRLQFNEQDDSVKLEGPIDRVFDAKPLSLSSKGGALLVSAGKEGLFHGSIVNSTSPLSMFMTPILGRSIRTGWVGWDTVNYSAPAEPTYLQNEIADDKSEKRQFLFSAEDETSERVSIEKFGVNQFTIKPPAVLAGNEIAYVFNTGAHFFFVMKNGACRSVAISRKAGAPHNLGSRTKQLPTRPKNGVPLSSASFEKGVVLDYFDRAVLLVDSKPTVIESRPSISVRTFPGARRFRRTILSTGESSIAMSIVLPSELAPARRAEPEDAVEYDPFLS